MQFGCEHYIRRTVERVGVKNTAEGEAHPLEAQFQSAPAPKSSVTVLWDF